MQKFLSLLVGGMMVLAFNGGCTKQDNTNECNEDIYNSKFELIVQSSTYNDVKTLIGWDGDLYRVDSTTGKKTEYYRWYTCSNTRFYIECRFTNGVLVLSNKTINNGSCADDISNETFDLVEDGMTYNQVKTILNNAGDHFRSSFSATTAVIFYRFYRCGDPAKYIEVWFNNGVAVVRQKNFQ